MFGGLAFLVNGHMCCGVLKKDLVLRVKPEDYEREVARAHARPMDFTGRPMRGLIYVRPAGVRSARDLRTWISRGLECVSSMPSK